MDPGRSPLSLTRALEEPRSRAFLEDASSWAMLGTLAVVQLVVSVLPGAVGWLLDLQLGPSLAVWMLLLLQVPALLAFRRAVRARHGVLFVWSLHTLTVIQGLWIHTIFLDTLGGFPVLGAVLLVGLTAAWAFNDAQVIYDDMWVRLAHAAPLVLVDLSLLIVDLFGGHGLIAIGRQSPTALVTLVLTQLLAAGLAQTILGTAGALNRRHHEAIAELAVERRQTDVARQERAFVRRVGDLLAGSLTVGRFSHDVAGPLMVIQQATDDLEDLLGDQRHPELDSILEDLRESGESLTEMVGFMSRCLRGEHETGPIQVEDLMAHARGHLRDTLRGHGIVGDSARLDYQVEPATVMADALLATAIANVAANGVLASGQAVRVRGRLVDPQTYRLTVRDHGLEGDERLDAIERVRDTLQMRGDALPRHAGYRGQGLGLVLARLISLRNGGELSVAVPASGPGLEVHMDLQIGPAAPAERPDEESLAPSLSDRRPSMAR